MLDIAGRYADGWWPAGAWTPEDFAAKLGALRQSAERAGRDPLAIVPAYIQICFLGDDAELAKILEAPLIKSLIMQFPGDLLKARSEEHTSELQSLMRISYAVFCLKKKNKPKMKSR